MKKLAVLAAIATVASVNAGELKLKGRFDYQSTESKDTAAGTTSKATSGEYSTEYLRLIGATKLNDTISAKLVLDLTDSNDAGKVNGLSKFVDEAFITKTFGSGFSAIVGKQAVLVGGRENDWSSRDVYSLSQFNDAIPGASTGLTVGYEVAGQSFYLQHLESEATTQLTDKKVTGLAWYGNFMDGMVSPIVSYHKVGTDEAGQYNTYLALGSQFKWNQIVAEVDYLMLTKENGGVNAAGTSKADVEHTSLVFHVKYNHENFRPFAKFIMETTEGDDSQLDGAGTEINTSLDVTETKNTAYEIGLEYYPNKDEDFRYHVVYANSTYESDKGRAGYTKFEREDTTIYAGLAFGMDLLK